MKKLTCFFLLSSFCISAKSQTVLHTESFETDGEGTRYTTNTFVDCPNSDFFFRTNTNPVTPPTCAQFFGTAFTNLQGSYFWASEDIRTSSPVQGSRPPGSITTQAINCAGYTGMNVSLFLATSNNNGIRWEGADSINIQASFDGTNYATVGRFMGKGTQFVGARLGIDGNLDGVYNGSDPVTDCDVANFTQYSFAIPGSGSNLYIRIDFDQMGGSEELAIDMLQVTGTFTCSAASVGTHPANTTTCAGNNTSFTVSASGTAPLSYQWQVNSGSGFSNITNGGVYSNATAATLNITGVLSTMNGYLYRCIVTNGCGSATSNSATLGVNATNNWTGAVSTDWHNTANWSCGTIPTTLTDVNIIGSPVNHPVILPGATGECRNMLKGGLSLGLTLNNATLRIHGNLTYNAGSFITNTNSSFQFAGSSGMQTLSGLTHLTISNLVINNPAGLLMGRNITLSGSLTFTSGKIFTADYFLKTATITGANSTNYVVTADAFNNPSADGGLTFSVTPGATNFYPVGPTSTSYNPATIRNTSGPAEDFTVRVNLNPLPGATSTRTVQRTWHIDEFTAVGGNTADITLQWDATHEGTLFTRTLCGVFKSNGTTIDYVGYSPQNGAATNISGSTWSKTLTGVTSFSPWGVTSDMVVLPVTLINFHIRKASAQIAHISWEVGDASSAASFLVEKSTDGRTFYPLKQIQGGIQTLYTTIDSSLSNAVTFYRLKIIGTDGHSAYSNILKVKNDYSHAAIDIYPNPVQDALHLVLNVAKQATGNCSIFNSEGKLMRQWPVNLLAGSTILPVDISTMPAGKYMVTFRWEDGVISHRFIKQ